MKTVLLYSGGLDSTVMLYKALEQNKDVLVLSFDYGQRHKDSEFLAAKEITDALGVERIVCRLPWQLFTGSSLTGAEDIPEGHYAEDNMASTIVPNRNAVMLTQAYAAAMGRSGNRVGIAAHAGDHFVYPDCRPEFFAAFAAMQGEALGVTIPLWLPFVLASKADIVKEGARLNVPFELTWSCYNGEDIHCGKCGTCVERAEAFHLAGVRDETTYRDPEFWKAAVSPIPDPDAEYDQV